MPRSLDDRRRLGELVALVNAGGVILWLNVFITWVNRALGTLNGELIGASMLAWPFLVVGASALTLLADRIAAARWLAFGVVLIMVVVLGDQYVGAIRDGDVSGEGLRLGALMGAEAFIALGALLVVPGRNAAN